jgi:hypothetical protein
MKAKEEVDRIVSQLTARADEWLRAGRETSSKALKREYLNNHAICQAKIDGLRIAQGFYEEKNA